MTTEQILSHIREVCGLIPGTIKCVFDTPDDPCNGRMRCGNCQGKGKTVYNPIHLEHLLYAIRKKGSDICISPDGTMIDLDTSDGYEITYKVLPDYDLTRTVEQNLTDNTELRELIISLIK